MKLYIEWHSLRASDNVFDGPCLRDPVYIFARSHRLFRNYRLRKRLTIKASAKYRALHEIFVRDYPRFPTSFHLSNCVF